MRFLRGGNQGPAESPEDQAQRLARDEKSRALVEAGGIPLQAQLRIEQQRASGGVWTSDLSVNEAAALRGTGYEPVALVMGSSLYRMSWINTGWNTAGRGMYGYSTIPTTENAGLTRSLFEARSRAIHRLLLEARGLGAEGVVGVRLTVRRWDWANGMAEFTVLGTAIRRPGATPPSEPFTSTLSGQDFAKLLSAGYFPLRLVMGASAQQAVAFFGGGFGGVSLWRNTEVTAFSQALFQAQHASRQRLAQEAAAAGGRGVVGVEIDSHVLEYPMGSESAQGRIVQWVVLGTAVTPRSVSTAPPRPVMVIPLRAKGA